MPESQILSDELRCALEKEELYALYQPQIDPATSQVVGVEGLCRWNRSDGAVVGPDVFIPLAEQNGLIHDVGLFMLDECLDQVGRWRERRRGVDVAVNVSPVQLTNDRFVDYLVDQLAERRLPGQPLTIEITESLPVAGIRSVVSRLEKVREAGVRVSLDDYGAGHASLAALDMLPLSEVKLDRSLIQNGDGASVRILRDAVERARELGLRVVAEGVETTVHLELATALGCDRVQGFLFAAPMTVEEVDELLTA